MRYLLIAALLAVGTARADDAPAVKLLSVKKIWDRGGHNAFTDLARFQGRWYCSFREGAGHVAGAGVCRVLASDDGATWEPAGLVESRDVDLRDPKLSVTPDGRLMMVGGAAAPADRKPLKDHYSFVCFSKDGMAWSSPQRVLDSWQWLWRVTWHNDRAYGVAYNWDQKSPDNQKNWTATIYQSGDGLKWNKLADVPHPNPTEGSLAFAGDELLCLLRRDGTPNSALLGRSKPPYTEWTWQDLGVFFGGPQLARAPDGSWWACGRMIDKGAAHTVLCRLHTDKGKLQPVLTLPSGGDTSYPGMIWHQGQLWISYYSSHEDRKACIYLARVQPLAP